MKYDIRYEDKEDDKNNVNLFLLAQPVHLRQKDFSLWVKVESNGTHILLPLQEAEITIFEKAFAEFRQGPKE